EALPADSPFMHLDPPQRCQCTLAALKRVLLRESQVQPLLLVFEDLHWIDSETQALLDSLVESLPTAHILLLVNYRPEYQHGWGSKTFYTQVRLDPLPPACADELLRALMGTDPSLGALTPLLIARTEGNPFFLEESVQTLVETQMLVGERGGYRLAHPLASLQVPATVQAVLAARIDRLPAEEKRLLQTAAVIGNAVLLPLLQAIAKLPEADLQGGLSHLQTTEFLYETRLFPEREYTFKHALTHEIAYGSLLQERRRALHAHIVETIQALARDRVAGQVECLAHHAVRGEVWDKALAYCRQAGEKALAQSAYREAVGSFEQALSTLPHLPEQRDTREQAIDLQLALSSALVTLADFGRALEVLREAESVAVTLDDSRRLGRSSSFCQDISSSWAPMTRLLPPPSMPLRSPRPAAMSFFMHWRTSTSAQPTGPRATIVGRSTAPERPQRSSTERGAMSSSAVMSYPPSPPVPASSGARPNWAYSPPVGPSGKKGCGLPRRWRTPRVSCVPLMGSVCWSSIKAICPGHCPCSNGLWASVTRLTSQAGFPW